MIGYGRLARGGTIAPAGPAALGIMYVLLLWTVGASALGPPSGPLGWTDGFPILLKEQSTAQSGVDWVNENPSVSPIHRAYAPMTYAKESDRVLVFGGIIEFGAATDVLDNATWTYNLNTNTWVEANPDPRPPPLAGHWMAYDEESDRVVLFGGCSSCPPSPFVGNPDTWVYNVGVSAWTNMAPTVHPPPRIGGVMAYDAESDRIILFGGLSTSFQFYFQTWAYDLNNNTWTDMAPSIRPVARDYQGMAYDAESDRVILFGGASASASFGDTWAYDFNANLWTDMKPTRAPSSRWYPGMVYDAESDRIIMFGGCTFYATNCNNETWAYDFNSNAWTNMNSPAPPAARFRHGLAYDSESDRTILFGGSTPNDILLSDTWSYDFVANRPGAPFTLQANAGDANVTLGWQPPLTDGGSPITGYRVYRGTSASSLNTLADVTVVTTYVDTSAANGMTYYYAVSAANAAGEGPPSNKVPATPGPGPDMIDPTIAITSPTDGATLTSTSVTVSGTASDDVALAKVELSRDGTNWILATGTTSWSSTLTLTEGSNTIYARATDTSGNTKTTNISVTMQPPIPPPPPPPPLWVLGVVIGAIGAVALAATWLVVKRRRGRPPGA